MGMKPSGKRRINKSANRDRDKRSGDYGQCDVCGQYGYVNSHVCPEPFQVKCPDLGLNRWKTTEIRDTYYSAALEVLKKLHSGQSVESLIPESGIERRVLVRRKKERTVYEFDVSVIVSPIYHVKNVVEELA